MTAAHFFIEHVYQIKLKNFILQICVGISFLNIIHFLFIKGEQNHRSTDCQFKSNDSVNAIILNLIIS